MGIANKIYPISILLFLCSVSLFGQNDTAGLDTSNTDDLFKLARFYAFNGQRPLAREYCSKILLKNPKYYDARVLKARTFAWDGTYDSSKHELHILFSQKPNYLDAISAMVDVQWWSGNIDSAIIYCDNGAVYYPRDTDLLFKKFKILKNNEQYQQAAVVLSQILDIDPNNAEALAQRKEIKNMMRLNRIGINYSFEYFEKPYYSRFHFTSYQIGRKAKWATLLFNLNIGDKIKPNEKLFSKETGIQYQLETYPRLTKKDYAFVAYSFAPQFFPHHALGLEDFHKLKNGFEYSLGIRYMTYGRGTDRSSVLIYTGTVGWYFQNYWLSVRPYVTPRTIDTISYSVQIECRRYFGSADNYLGLLVGTGTSPDDPQNVIRYPESYRLDSQKFRITYEDKFNNRLSASFKAGMVREEYRYLNHRFSVDFSATFQYYF